MAFDKDELRYRFAVWAAVRAAQRKSKAVKLERCVPAFNKRRDDWFKYFAGSVPSQLAYDQKHLQFVDDLKEDLDVTFGRAAKLLNVYLKVTITFDDRRLDWHDFVHPPIDSILLRSTAQRAIFDRKEKAWLKKARWTKFDAKDYQRAIELLRRIGPGWRGEEDWTPQGSS